MANYREIVTKAVIGKGKKEFTNHYTMSVDHAPSTILGCWVINHKFSGVKEKGNIVVRGNFDVNVWYSYDNDTKTYVAQNTINYEEILNVNKSKECDSPNEEIIVRCLSGPTCTSVEISNGSISYNINKELGIELVGDTKMRIAISDDEDEWEDLNNEEVSKTFNNFDENIDEQVTENFITEKNKSI